MLGQGYGAIISATAHRPVSPPVIVPRKLLPTSASSREGAARTVHRRAAPV